MHSQNHIKFSSILGVPSLSYIMSVRTAHSVHRLNYGVDNERSSSILAKDKRFSPLWNPDQPWIPHSLLFNDHRKLFLSFKRPEREGEHSQSCSAEANNANSPRVKSIMQILRQC